MVRHTPLLNILGGLTVVAFGITVLIMEMDHLRGTPYFQPLPSIFEEEEPSSPKPQAYVEEPMEIENNDIIIE